MHRRYKLIFIPLNYGELLAKNNFRTKIGRGPSEGASQKNVGTPTYLFLQPLKVATSNLVAYTTWVWGVRYNNSFSTKLDRGCLDYRSTLKIVWTRYYVPCTT